MLSEDYEIDIKGKQFYEEDSGIDPGEVVLRTTGSYTEKDGARFISYKEYDSDDPKVSYTSVLKVEPEMLTMIRVGTDTKLILEKGQRHTCLYDTGFGTLSVGLFTSLLEENLNAGGGSLKVKYTLDIDSSLSSLNELEVNIRPISTPTA